MPRSLQDILDHADELADWVEAYEPRPEDHRDPAPMKMLRRAMAARAAAERDIVAAVSAARDAGYSWAAIGALLGTSGEAARQRYAQLIAH